MKDSYHLEDDKGRIAALAFLTPDVLAGERCWLFNRIFVVRGSRGKGYGGRLLNHICREAGRERVTLTLGIDPDWDSPLQEKELIAFYNSRGFEGYEDQVHNLMVRRPKMPNLNVA